ncbi:hypothetical protein, partial [Mycobacterium interjectum]|uniref:hypothetical protein n=1 Tax=Mycobacterium interjectum TaxID=33895 RepID=UPI0021F2BD53
MSRRWTRTTSTKRWPSGVTATAVRSRSLRGVGSDPTQPEVVCAEVALPAGTEVAGYGIHPALLDAAL